MTLSEMTYDVFSVGPRGTAVQRRRPADMGPNNFINDLVEKSDPDHIRQKSWHRILLLIIAITIHNIPGMLLTLYLSFR